MRGRTALRASAIALLGVTACTEGLDFREPEPEPGPEPPHWRGPEIADIEWIEGRTLDLEDTTMDNDTGVMVSHFEHRIEGNADTALLMASVYDTDANRYRALVARYDAFSSKGTGWATEGPDLRIFGSGSTDYFSVAGQVSPAGDLLALFMGSPGTETRYLGEDGWEAISGYSFDISHDAGDLIDRLGYGHLSDMAWGDDGTGYLSYADHSTGDLGVLKYNGEWSLLDTPDTGSPDAIVAGFNGYVPITVWEDAGDLMSAAPTLDSEGAWDEGVWATTTLADVSNSTHIDAASDDRGNTVVVFLDDLDPEPVCSTDSDPLIGNCERRVFGMVRNILGTWAGPTLLDDDFTVENTTHEDDIGSSDTYQWTYPKVVYLSDGVFLLVFSITDGVKRTSGVYSKTYTVGTGWSSNYETIIEEDLAGDDEIYRMAKRLNLVTDGEGGALLTMSYVTTNDSLSTARRIGYQIFRYSKGSFNLEATVEGAYSCPEESSTLDCSDWYMAPEAHLFPGGEAIVAFPALDLAKDVIRLYTLSYY